MPRDGQRPTAYGGLNRRALPALAAAVLSLLLVSVQGHAPAAPSGAAAQLYLPVIQRGGPCPFGITAPYGVAGYNLAGLGAGAYLDWGQKAAPARPGGIEYVQMVRLGDAYYADHLASLPATAAAQPGSAWLVGNEPDTTYVLESGAPQDNLAPAVYAERYHAVYQALKAADPTARVGFGGIVQPTAVRREYLERVRAAYQAGYGTPPPADFWHIHAFVLNEVPGQWGTGLPVDHATQPYTAEPEAFGAHENASLARFISRLEAFRAWMAALGERDKPLWITEYGVLMPSDGSLGYFTIPIETTREFMLASFDYLLAAAHTAHGVPADGHRLVQRWFWWSLSGDLRKSGGALYDLSSGAPIKTLLFDAYAGASPCH